MVEVEDGVELKVGDAMELTATLHCEL